MDRIAYRAAILATLLAAAGCAPLITRIDLQPLAEGSAKDAEARIATFVCAWHQARARYRRSGASTWTDLPPATMVSGEIQFLSSSWWRTPVAGSEAFMQGQTFDVQWTVPYSSTWPNCDPGETVRTETFTVTRPFAVSAVPSSIQVPANGSAAVTLQVQRFGTFSAPVTIAPTNFPTGVTPSSPAITVPGASAALTLTAAASAPAGTGTVRLDATSPGRTPQQASLAVSVTRPHIDSVAPSIAPHGATITVSGSGFDAVCGNNNITYAGLTVVPSSCTGTTVVRGRVEPQAPYGPTSLSVTSNGVTTNAVAFTVARAPGAFVKITGDIQNQVSSPRSCTSGSVRVEVASITGPYRSHRAAYRRASDGSTIGSPIEFQRDTPPTVPGSGNTPQSVSNLGGAGFSLCTTGVVLDANARDISNELLAYHFLRLDDGGRFFKSFNYWTRQIGVDLASIDPDLHRSPDGTVFIAVVASAIGVARKAIVIDRQDGRSTEIEFDDTRDISSAQITDRDEITITHSNRTYGPIPIP